MNREIKETLDNTLEYLEGINETRNTKILTTNETKILLDYITNLQEENERLKELCDKYEEEHSTTFKIWTMKMKEMPDYEEKMNYKSRIDKAIELINKRKEEDNGIGWLEMRTEKYFEECDELINILKDYDEEIKYN